jgi:O-methyltransferase
MTNTTTMPNVPARTLMSRVMPDSQRLQVTAKRLLSQAIPDSLQLQVLSWLPRLNTWKRQAGKCPMFDHRYKMYEWLNSSVLGNREIDYLEFGVFKGDSIRRWTEMNQNSTSRFFGFDTFTGLPEAWAGFTEPMKQGSFDVGGAIPNIDDKRIGFVKGLFQSTLPSFLKGFTPANRLVVHIDADLYSATLYVLTYMNDVIKPDTIIVFDEFSSVLHEFRALEDYCAAYMRKYEVLSAVRSPSDYYSQVAIKVTA